MAKLAGISNSEVTVFHTLPQRSLTVLRFLPVVEHILWRFPGSVWSFPTSFTSSLLSPQGLPISMYGGTLIPSHPQLADGPGGPLFNGLHTPDPAWNPMIKVVQNSTECTDAQQVVWLPFPACAFLGLYTVL